MRCVNWNHTEKGKKIFYFVTKKKAFLKKKVKIRKIFETTIFDNTLFSELK